MNHILRGFISFIEGIASAFNRLLFGPPRFEPLPKFIDPKEDAENMGKDFEAAMKDFPPL